MCVWHVCINRQIRDLDWSTSAESYFHPPHSLSLPESSYSYSPADKEGVLLKKIGVISGAMVMDANLTSR